MRGTDAEFILGAEHTQRLNATNLAALDLELLVATIGVENRAYRGTQHLQALAAVGRTAHNLQRLLGAYIHLCDVQVVRVGVVPALYDVAYNNTLQASANALHLLQSLHLKTYVGEDCGYLLSREVDVDILL